MSFSITIKNKPYTVIKKEATSLPGIKKRRKGFQ